MPSVPSVLSNDIEDMKMLFMRMDANCTIRNSDIKKFQRNLPNAGSRKGSQSFDPKSRLHENGWHRRVRSTGMGLVANYEQRIKDIKDNPPQSPLERKINPWTTDECLIGKDTVRIPSAPLERTILTHNLSLLSL